MIPMLLVAAAIASSPDLGKAEGQCHAGEKGSEFLVEVTGLKDRAGRLKLELYPSNDTDFLADDNVLVGAGKAFRRVEEAVPASGPVALCIRAPGPGTYSLSGTEFYLTVDGVGYSAVKSELLHSDPTASVNIDANFGVRITFTNLQGQTPADRISGALSWTCQDPE